MLSFDLSLISRFRTQLMGIATIMIIACHAPASNVLMPSSIAKLLSLGNWGVDIFLFLSGVVVYYSLRKRGGGIFLITKKGLVGSTSHIL